MSIRGTAAIVGAAESDIGVSQGRSPAGLMAQASKRALEDAGLRLSDVDGLFTSSSYHSMPTLTLGEYLGVKPRYVDSTAIGGCSFIAHLTHAAAVISAGLCDVALIAYGSTQRSDRGKLVSLSEWLPYEQPYGLIHPISSFGMIAHRHMARVRNDQRAAGRGRGGGAVLGPAEPQGAVPHPPDRGGGPVLTGPSASPLHKARLLPGQRRGRRPPVNHSARNERGTWPGRRSTCRGGR